MVKKNIFIIFFSFFIFSCYSQKIELQTKNSGIKQTSLLYEDGILTIDHIKSKVIDISIPKTMPIKKVIFNFVDLTEVTEDFWKSFEETEYFVFSFTTLNNLEFLTYLKNAKAISFKESNYIESYSVSLSSNQNLEYLEIQALDLSEIKFKNTIYENLKYLVIYNAKFTDNCYERIIKYFGKETCYIINKEQMAYFSKYKYAEPDIIYDVWDEYNIQ